MHDPYFDHRLDARSFPLWTSVVSLIFVVAFVGAVLLEALRGATSVA
ncbi:MAG: hypothetical protein AB7H66_12535 [Hyphomonadaceae bacterium]